MQIYKLFNQKEKVEKLTKTFYLLFLLLLTFDMFFNNIINKLFHFVHCFTMSLHQLILEVYAYTKYRAACNECLCYIDKDTRRNSMNQSETKKCNQYTTCN